MLLYVFIKGTDCCYFTMQVQVDTPTLVLSWVSWGKIVIYAN